MKKLICKRIVPFIMALMLGMGVWAANGISPTAPVEVLAADYYAGIDSTAGEALLGDLHDLITTTHKKYTTYDDCSTPSIVKQTDAGSNSSSVMEFYTQLDIASSWGGGKVGTWNREHVWCQSRSNGLWGKSGGGSDLHHIRPSESSLNSTRGNHKFGEVTGGTAAYYHATSNPKYAVGGYVASDVFEPLDQVKGDVARIVMYVYTHYNTYSNVGGTTNGSGKASFGTLKFTNIVSANNEEGAIDLLLRWNQEDPVDSIETSRNDAVYGIQGNRNPFIDHPEYAEAIWGDGAPVTSVTGLTVSPKDVTLNVGSSKQLSVTVTPGNASDRVNWTSSNENVAVVSSTGVVTAKGVGTATITATSKVTPSVSDRVSVTVNETQNGGGDVVVGAKSVTITKESFQMTEGYGFKNWTAGDIGGIAFVYGGNSAYSSTGIQFNIKQSSYYLASNVAAPGGIVSVTVKLIPGKTTERPWKLLTSDTAYGEVAGKPTNGTDHGTQPVSEEGTTWYLDGTQAYFALTYELEESSGACYIESIVVEYGEQQGKPDEKPDPTPGETPDEGKIASFKSAVAAISQATTLKEKKEAIDAAALSYRELTIAEQDAVQSEYAQLQTAIGEYNELIIGYNGTTKTFVELALDGFGAFFDWIGSVFAVLLSFWM